jgi:hypothetical protein
VATSLKSPFHLLIPDRALGYVELIDPQVDPCNAEISGKAKGEVGVCVR